MIMMAFAAAMLIPAQAADPPALRRMPEGALILDTPGTVALQAYRVRFEPASAGAMTVAEQLERALAIEPWRLVSADEAAGTALIETSEWGAFRLTTNNHDWSAIRVAEVTPSVERVTNRTCSNVVATLALSDDSPSTAEASEGTRLCPAAEELVAREHLVIEGLDAAGRSLWVARGADPRFYRYEDLSPGGVRETGQHDEPELTTTFRAPLTPDLARLRWYEVTPDNELRPIGEMAWEPPAAS